MICILSAFQHSVHPGTSVISVLSPSLCAAPKCIMVPLGIEVKTSSYLVSEEQTVLSLALEEFVEVRISPSGTFIYIRIVTTGIFIPADGLND